MRRGILTFWLVLLVLVSSGCTEGGQAPTQEEKTTTTTLTVTTEAEEPTTPESIEEPTEAPSTTTNPKFKLLTLDDVGQDYLVTESKYDDLDTVLDEGIEIEAYTALKNSGFIESYTVAFGNDTKKVSAIKNIVSRYDSKSSVEKRLEYFREQYSNKENFPDAESVSILLGREFGDGTVYSSATYKMSLLGTDIYIEDISLHFSKENYKVNIVIRGFRGNVKVSDIYPYASILEDRISSDEKIVPPTISPKTTTTDLTTQTTESYLDSNWYKTQKQKQITHLEIDYEDTKNGNADADADGFVFHLKPLADDETVVPVNADVEIKIYNVVPKDKWEYEFNQNDLVYTKNEKMESNKFEVFEFSEEVRRSQEIRVNWDDITPYPTTALSQNPVISNFSPVISS